jgi:hypothetical protein
MYDFKSNWAGYCSNLAVWIVLSLASSWAMLATSSFAFCITSLSWTNSASCLLTVHSAHGQVAASQLLQPHWEQHYGRPTLARVWPIAAPSSFDGAAVCGKCWTELATACWAEKKQTMRLSNKASFIFNSCSPCLVKRSFQRE